MTNLNSEFNPKASGLPTFGIQTMFEKLANAVSGNPTPSVDVGFDSTFEHSM